MSLTSGDADANGRRSQSVSDLNRGHCTVSRRSIAVLDVRVIGEVLLLG